MRFHRPHPTRIQVAKGGVQRRFLADQETQRAVSITTLLRYCLLHMQEAHHLHHHLLSLLSIMAMAIVTITGNHPYLRFHPTIGALIPICRQSTIAPTRSLITSRDGGSSLNDLHLLFRSVPLFLFLGMPPHFFRLCLLGLAQFVYFF
jgi:hypothetical protein